MRPRASAPSYSLSIFLTDATVVRRAAHASAIVPTAPSPSPPRWSTSPTERRNASSTSICTTLAVVHSASCVSPHAHSTPSSSATTSSRPCLPARNLCSSSTISPSSRAIPRPRLLPRHPRQPLPHLRPRPPRLLQPNPKRKKN